MLYPSINVLRSKVDSRYTLVMLAAKRSRDLISGRPALLNTEVQKPVSISTEEIAKDMITYSRDFTTEEEAIELAEEDVEIQHSEEEVTEETAVDEEESGEAE